MLTIIKKGEEMERLEEERDLEILESEEEEERGMGEEKGDCGD